MLRKTLSTIKKRKIKSQIVMKNNKLVLQFNIIFATWGVPNSLQSIIITLRCSLVRRYVRTPSRENLENSINVFNTARNYLACIHEVF